MGGMRTPPSRIHLPLDQRVNLILQYLSSRLWDQAKAFLPIVGYLAVFQVLVLGQGVRESLTILLGITAAVAGLALFMEGLYLTFMPLGETLGIGLPRRWPLPAVLVFALILGAAATFAEPAIGVLKAAGASVQPWTSPLLYMVLNGQSSLLVLAIALGVGLAVSLGMLKLLYGWTMKVLLLLFMPPILILTVVSALDPLVAPLVGLAWDSGGITTGPVTVPLVLALGLGVARISSREEEDAGGFGMVTLASLLPVATVLLLGWYLASEVPEAYRMPLASSEFFAPENREWALRVVGGEESLATFSRPEQSDLGLAKPGIPAGLSWAGDMLLRQAGSAFQAVVPLTAFLLLVFFWGLREKMRFLDEKILGLVLAFLGMLLFGSGIEAGLGRLGAQVGQTLPASFRTLEKPGEAVVWEGVTSADLRTVYHSAGGSSSYLLKEEGGRVEYIPFREDRYNPESQSYLYVPSLGPLYGSGWGGLAVVLLFAFLMGYGATLAEPALLAMSRSVEDVTVGVVSRKQLTQTVALGVGAGLVLGMGKILWNLPLGFILPGIYVLLMILTLVSGEDFVNIAYDSAGVTTGPVTVPLVVVIGLSLGGEMGVMDGFGVLASASALPILGVLLLGLFSRSGGKRAAG